MKKVKLTEVLFVLILVTVLSFTSCDKDEFTGPTMVIELLSADVNGWINDTIQFEIRLSSDGDLLTFQVTPSIPGTNASSQYLKDDYIDGEKSDTITYIYVIPATVEVDDTITLDFTVTDMNQLSESASDTIYIVRTEGPINTYYEKILGSYDSDYGSSFCSANGEVFTMVEAFENPDSIDFLYFFGATNHATIAAPNDVVAATVFSGEHGLENWTTRNATLFKETTLTSNDFLGINNDIPIIDAAGGAHLTKITGLEETDVIAFVTAATSAHPNKKGLIYVWSITAGGNGDIEIVVKVQASDK